MITITTKEITSFNNGSPVVSLRTQQLEALHALESFVIHELDAGGQIVDVDFPFKVVVKRRVSSSKFFLTTFEGLNGEIERFFRVAYCWLSAKQHNGEQIPDHCSQFVTEHPELISEFSAKFPMTGPMFSDSKLAKSSLLLGLLRTHEDVMFGLELTLPELMKAIQTKIDIRTSCLADAA